MLNRMDKGASTGRSAALLAALLPAIAVFLLLATPHARADCPVTDPTCVADSVGGVAEDPVGTVEQTVDEVASTAQETVDEVASTAQETVDETVQTVEETIEETVPPVEEAVPPVEETIDDVLGAGSVGQTSPAQAPQPSDDPSGMRDGPGGRPEALSRPRADVGRTFIDSTSIGSAPVAASGAARVANPVETAGIVDDVVAALAFPTVLGLIVGAFVAAQNRLDRRDPKLALAPIGPDVLSFS